MQCSGLVAQSNTFFIVKICRPTGDRFKIGNYKVIFFNRELFHFFHEAKTINALICFVKIDSTIFSEYKIESFHPVCGLKWQGQIKLFAAYQHINFSFFLQIRKYFNCTCQVTITSSLYSVKYFHMDLLYRISNLNVLQHLVEEF